MTVTAVSLEFILDYFTLLDYFTSLALKLYADIAGIIVTAKKVSIAITTNREQKIEVKTKIKKLGINMDNGLSYQSEGKK